MDIHLKIIGGMLMLLALIHIFFPKYFHWKEDLAALELINRQMMTTHTFFIALTVFLMGVLAFFYTTPLTETTFGKVISGGLAIFWAIRLFFQLFVYSTKLWRGKQFETIIHLFFVCFWIYLTWVFGWNAWT